MNHDEFDRNGGARGHGSELEFDSADEDIYDDTSSGDGNEGERGGRKKKNKKGYDKDEDEYYQTIR